MNEQRVREIVREEIEKSAAATADRVEALLTEKLQGAINQQPSDLAFIQRERRLKAELGDRCFKETVGAIKSAIQEANLESAPTVLADLLDHVKQGLLLEKI